MPHTVHGLSHSPASMGRQCTGANGVPLEVSLGCVVKAASSTAAAHVTRRQRSTHCVPPPLLRSSICLQAGELSS